MQVYWVNVSREEIPTFFLKETFFMSAVLSVFDHISENEFKVLTVVTETVMAKGENGEGFVTNKELIKYTSLTLPTIRVYVQALNKIFFERVYACGDCKHEFGPIYNEIQFKKCPKCGKATWNNIKQYFKLVMDKITDLFPVMRSLLKYAETVIRNTETDKLIDTELTPSPTETLNMDRLNYDCPTKAQFYKATRGLMQLYTPPKLRELARYVNGQFHLRECGEWIQALALIIDKRRSKPEEAINTPRGMLSWAFDTITREAQEKPDEDTYYDKEMIRGDMARYKLILLEYKIFTEQALTAVNSLRCILNENPVSGVECFREVFKKELASGKLYYLLHILIGEV